METSCGRFIFSAIRVATAFLIRGMAVRSFVVAVTYSKTEIVQIGLFSLAILAEPVTAAAAAAIALASVGVLLLSAKPGAMPGTDLRAWLSPSAAIGLASGACFALSAVGYRGAAIALGHPLPSRHDEAERLPPAAEILAHVEFHKQLRGNAIECLRPWGD